MYLHSEPFAYGRPSEKDFDVEIITNHPEVDGRKLRQFSLDGIKTIGVAENEPFQINFTNNSRENVSVRISLDGIDTLSGKAADLNTDGTMWFVRSGKTLHLKAWHETSAGGARLVFTHEKNSVALNTTGDVSHKGIIAFAVFMEETAPSSHWSSYNNTYSTKRRSMDYFGGSDVIKGAAISGGLATNSIVEQSAYRNSDDKAIVGGRLNSDGTTCDVPVACAAESYDLYSERIVEINDGDERTKSLSKSAAIGAGEYTEQKTQTVSGLTKPVINSIMRMRYMWWNELETLLKNHKHVEKFASGFPGAKTQTYVDLSNVPRVMSTAATRTEEPAFQRTY